MGVHRAVADAERARTLAGTDSPFTIEVRFGDGLTDTQRDAFASTADRWVRVIVGDLPAAVADGAEIDDVRIDASGITIDEAGGVLGRAGPTVLRPASAGTAAGLPVLGVMEFDTGDLAELERSGGLLDVITHEMGHVLGFGTVWAAKGLLRGGGGADPTFGGPAARVEYRALGGRGSAVPVENAGGPGTRDAHWRESVFGAELMTGFLDDADNPMSRVTVASLADLGYQVDLDAAEPYTLPAPSAARRPGPERHLVLRTTRPGAPTVLAD